MPTQRRATIESDVARSIDQMVSEATRYLDPNSFEVRQMARTIDKLAAADPVVASVQRAMLKHLCGDVEGALYWVNNARTLSPSMAAAVSGAEIVILSNLGYFTEAAKVISTLDEVTRLQHAHVLLAAACWDELAALGETGVGKGACESAPVIALAQACQSSLQKVGATQDQVRAILDLAGEVLRRNGLFFLGEGPVLHYADEGILYELTLRAEMETVLRLTLEVMQAAVDHDRDAGGLGFSFLAH